MERAARRPIQWNCRFLNRFMPFPPIKKKKKNQYGYVFIVAATATTEYHLPPPLCSAHRFDIFFIQKASLQQLSLSLSLSLPPAMRRKKRETKRPNIPAAVLHWILFTRHYLVQFPLLTAFFGFLLLLFAAFAFLSPLPPIINHHNHSSQVHFLSLLLRFLRSWLYRVC